MRRHSKFILILLILAVAIAAFTACKNVDKEDMSVTFISGDEQYATAGNIEQVKKIFENQPVREGYVFKGWYLDKGTWQQEVASENVESIIKSGDNVSVYAYWLEIVNRIVVSFRNYNGAILLEREYERTDDELAKDISILVPAKRPDDEMYTYTFKEWDCDTSDLTETYYLATPIYDSELRTFDFNYYVDGKLVYTDKVKYGQDADLSLLAEPKKPSTDKYDYVFKGWEGNSKNITADTDVHAIFQENIKRFDVVFNFGDGKSVTRNVAYGESAVAPTDREVARESTPQYDFVFVGWDNTYDNIKQNTVVNAKYVEQTRSYEVKFFVDDECIKSVSVPYGMSAQAPTQPVKVTNDGFTYEFIGWDKTFDSIVEDINVNALFDKKAHTYTVQYINWDGEVLDVQKVEASQPSVYGGVEPTRESNDKFEYEFVGWTDEESLKSVSKDFAVYAIYQEIERTYTVTFNYGHGLKKQVEGISYGTNLEETDEIPSDVAKTSTAQFDFTFIDWDKYLGYISRDMEVNAIYKETLRKYIVTFINNGAIVKSQEVEYGKCPTAPIENIFRNDTVQWDYSLLGWSVSDIDTLDSASDFDGVDPDLATVEGEVTYTAIYLRTIQRYTVKFFNEEGASEILAEITVDYGTDVIADGLAPAATKSSSPKFDYFFAQWSKDLTKIEANIEVYAIYDTAIRSYKVSFMNGDEVYAEYLVEYGSASPIPDVDPTKNSDVQYDYEFIKWDGVHSYVEGESVVNALYSNILRYYKVSYFNLATYEFISTVEMGYGSKITTTISRDGYDFDSWYRDPNCNTVFNMEEDFVDGTMMLFGNTVMKGLQFNGNNEIVGYDGTQSNLIIPIAANGRKVSIIKKEAFKGNTVIGSVYIPGTISKVENYAFSGLNLTESGGIYVQSKKGLTKPSGWDEFWNWNGFGNIGTENRPVTYGVDGIYTVGNFQYVLISDGNYAIVDKMISNNTAKAYIEDALEHKKAFFTSTVEIDEKTGIERDVYTIGYETNTYNITRIAVSAFEGCENVSSVFIPKTIEKVGNYAFSGVTAKIFIQREQPALGSNIPSGWGIYWNSNRKGQEGERTLYWGVVDMDRVGAYSYIFMSDGTAIAVEYNGSTSVTSVDVPSNVVFKDVTYTVTELGDELFGNMMLLNTVTLNDGLKKIGNKVFYMDAMLSKVTLPSTLEEIGDYAFLGALALKEIYIPASVKTIGMLVFIGIDNLTIYCGVEKAPIYILGSSGYNPLWDVKLGLGDIGDLTDLKGIAGTLVNPNRHTVHYNVAGLYTDTASSTGRQTNFQYILYNDGTAKIVSSSNTILNVETYTLPETITYNERVYTVTAVGANAFAGNTAIKTLIIQSTVTSVEENAFKGCSNLTIKTTHGSKPSGWNNNFNPDNLNVEYGYVINAAEVEE